MGPLALGGAQHRWGSLLTWLPATAARPGRAPWFSGPTRGWCAPVGNAPAWKTLPATCGPPASRPGSSPDSRGTGMAILEARASPSSWVSWAWRQVTAQPQEFTNSSASLMSWQWPLGSWPWPRNSIWAYHSMAPRESAVIRKPVFNPLLPPINQQIVHTTFTCTRPYGISWVVIEDNEWVPHVDGNKLPADDARAVAVYVFYNHREAEIRCALGRNKLVQ